MAKNHGGQSVAAWTAVGILLFAAFLIALAVLIASWPLAIAGMVLVVVGAAAGKIMANAGFGVKRPEKSPPATADR